VGLEVLLGHRGGLRNVRHDSFERFVFDSIYIEFVSFRSDVTSEKRALRARSRVVAPLAAARSASVTIAVKQLPQNIGYGTARSVAVLRETPAAATATRRVDKVSNGSFARLRGCHGPPSETGEEVDGIDDETGILL
jgi:hypothetical protein